MVTFKKKYSKKIALVQYSSNFGGSTISGLLIVKYLLSHNYEVHVIFGFSGPFEKIYRAEGCTTEVIPHRNWLRSGSLLHASKNWIREFRTSRLFEKTFARAGVDIVYINSLVSLSAALAAKRCNLVTIWHLRELLSDIGGEMHAPRLIGRHLIRYILQHFCTQVVCISKAVEYNLLGDHHSANTQIIPNAVDRIYFEKKNKKEAREALGLPAKLPVIGIPGTLRPLKGHGFLFRSAKKILRVHPSTIIAISGTHSDSYAESVIQQAKSTGVAANCKFLGNIPDMRNFYAASDIICVPSKSESFGRTVIEAFATSRPVVASAVGGILETIKDGVNGFLVEYNDTEKLAEVLIELIENKTLARKISEEARNCAALEYTADICGNRIKDVINEATEQYAK